MLLILSMRENNSGISFPGYSKNCSSLSNSLQSAKKKQQQKNFINSKEKSSFRRIVLGNSVNFSHYPQLTLEITGAGHIFICISKLESVPCYNFTALILTWVHLPALLFPSLSELKKSISYIYCRCH